MNPKVILSFLTVLAIFCLPLFAEPAEAPEEKRLRLEMEDHVNREVVGILQSRVDITDFFGRNDYVPPNFRPYSVVVASTGPDGIMRSMLRVPFEVRIFEKGNTGTKLYISGYYDVKAETVLLYSQAMQKYVSAAKHPYLKKD